MEIIKKEDTTPLEALNTLESKDEEKLSHEQTICLEFLRKHLKLKDEKTIEELKKELEEMDKFKEHHLDKIIEILPETEDEVKALFSKERIKLEDSDIEKVIEVCKSVKE